MYSIYVQGLPQYKSKVEIIIYPQLQNIYYSNLYKMPYCPLRKLHTFDFPKNAFNCFPSFLNNTKNKKLRFNFLVNGNLFISPHYHLVNIDNHYINQIDFAEIDERIQHNKKLFCNYFLRKKCFEFKPIENINRSKFSDDICSNLTFESDDDEYDGLRLRKAESNEDAFSKTSTDYSDFGIERNEVIRRNRKRFVTDSIVMNSTSILKSILKETGRVTRNERKMKQRRVSFGTVQFSY